MTIIKGFKDFITRGNVVDLAVGIIIGAAFGGVITALNAKIITPLIAWVFGKPNFDNLLAFGPTVDGVPSVQIGGFLTVVVNFLITAAAIYFFIVAPLNALAERKARGEEPAPTAVADDIRLLTQIRDLLAADVAVPSANSAAASATDGTTPAV